MNDINTLSKTQYAIINQISKAIARLDGDMELRAIIGSWGDTLPEDEILHLLKKWNATQNMKDRYASEIRARSW